MRSGASWAPGKRLAGLLAPLATTSDAIRLCKTKNRRSNRIERRFQDYVSGAERDRLGGLRLGRRGAGADGNLLGFAHHANEE